MPFGDERGWEKLDSRKESDRIGDFMFWNVYNKWNKACTIRPKRDPFNESVTLIAYILFEDNDWDAIDFDERRSWH